MLVDSVEIKVSAGNGGDGVISWRREKFIARGGPDGGNGGRGGEVIFRASHNCDTLSSFRYRKVFRAEDGKRGASKKKTGRSGGDLILLVPVGTVIGEAATGRMLVDLRRDGQTALIARGGRGGLGNAHFVSSINQSPHKITTGQLGETKELKLELRLLADLAMIGAPNAGKSTLINRLAGADLPTGAYPFSTREPYLAVMRHKTRQIVLLDLPGLLEGAHAGRGLGDRFLQHLHRVKGLIQIIDGSRPEEISRTSDVILEEVRLFERQLANLPRLLVINKIDLLEEPVRREIAREYPPAILVSALTGANLEILKTRLLKLVGNSRLAR